MTVTTAAGCPWTAASNVPWLTLTGGASGNGPGQVSFQAAPGVEARSGTLTIAGRAFTVNQSAGCSYSLAPEVQNVDAGEASFSVGVDVVARVWMVGREQCAVDHHRQERRQWLGQPED